MRLYRNRVKGMVLQRIAGNTAPAVVGTAKFRIGRWVVHTRYCSENVSAPEKYKFNINPNTLSADFELWICGGPEN